MSRCPGQDFRRVTAEIHRCPECGEAVEIFSDEQRRRCPKCRTMVFVEETPSCVQWCTAAKECLGPERYAKVMAALGKSEEDEDEESESSS